MNFWHPGKTNQDLSLKYTYGNTFIYQIKRAGFCTFCTKLTTVIFFNQSVQNSSISVLSYIDIIFL